MTFIKVIYRATPNEISQKKFLQNNPEVLAHLGPRGAKFNFLKRDTWAKPFIRFIIKEYLCFMTFKLLLVDYGKSIMSANTPFVYHISVS